MTLGPQRFENDHYRILINGFLNQRKVINIMKKDALLNRSDLEIMAYAFHTGFFNAYEIKKHFSVMNVQQVQKSLQKLQRLCMLEVISNGGTGKPKVYVLSFKGEIELKKYVSLLDRVTTASL